MRADNMDFNVPPSFSGDAELAELLYKSIYDYGLKGLYYNPQIGAPSGSSLIDTPFLDLTYAIEIDILSKFLNNQTCVIYMVYFLSYPLSAMTMYILMTKLTDDVIVKYITSVAFAITPYHFIRGMGHGTLSNYYIVPITILISIIIYEKDFNKGIVSKWGPIKNTILYITCFIIGLSNVYYVYFGLICMFTSIIFKIFNKNRKGKKVVRLLCNELVPLYVTLLGLICSLLPSIIYSYKYGSNEISGIRQPLETEIYALKLIQMLLPCSYNRVKLLQKTYSAYTDKAFNINENSFASLGIIATIGFILSCIYIVKVIANRQVSADLNDNNQEVNETINLISFLILTNIIYCTAGGIGTIVSYVITPELRCLNRVSIVIACLSFCVIALTIKKFNNKKTNYIFIVVIYIFALMFAIYSEVPINQQQWQNDNAKQNNIYSKYFSEIETKFPNIAIYEIPHMNFPESGSLNNMGDYFPAIGYQYTNTIKWSYGGVKGRNDTAENLYINDGMSASFVKQIIENGFSGVLIFRSGYVDNGENAINYYSNILGLSPIISDDDQLYYYDLTSLDESKLSKYYEFIKKFSSDLDVKISEDEIKYIADLMENDKETAGQIIYSWISNNYNFDNENFISLLYKEILGRVESIEENESWCNDIKNGKDRETVLLEFLSSEEFNSKY